jgi:hypothetical protein
MMDLSKLTDDERTRWNAIYGAIVAKVALTMLDDHVEAGESGLLPAEQMQKVNELAAVIASGSILAAREGKTE